MFIFLLLNIFKTKKLPFLFRWQLWN